MVWEGEGGGDTRVLKEGIRESRWKRVARFRLGNEMREGRYWEEEMQAMWKGGGNMGARVGGMQGLEGEGRGGLTGNSG